VAGKCSARRVRNAQGGARWWENAAGEHSVEAAGGRAACVWGRCLLVAHVLLLRVELEEIPLHLLLRLDALLVHLRPREGPVTFLSIPSPPLSLPYEVDTSRPSLRTNWTRFLSMPLICCQWTYSSTNMLSSFTDGGPQRAQLMREGRGGRGVRLK
jgi:hypothetical protein